MQRSLLAAAVATATAAGLLATVPAAHAAAPRPDLHVTRVAVDKTTAYEGAKIKVTHTVANRGKARAPRSVTRFYLTTDVARSLAERRASRTNPRSSLTDVLLKGVAAVGAVKPGRSVTPRRRAVATVPVGTPPGSYRVLVCTDDRGTVKESDEGDNCTVATRALEVAAAPGSDDLTVQAFSQTSAWPESEAGNLQYVKAFCASHFPEKRFTLSGAIASVRAHLEQHAPGGVSEVARSGLADSPVAAQQLAVAGLAQGAPGLAMAALLRAHQLEPTNGRHLLNAAALATSISLPNEAIALVDAAAGRDFRRPAAGIPHEATALAVRGHALLMLGRYDAAQPLFARAKQMAPLLNEADIGLATVAACKDQDTLAIRYLRRARIVSDDPVPPTPPTEEPEQPEPAIDLAPGTAMPLRQLPVAETPSQGVQMNAVYRQIQSDLRAQSTASIEERTRIEQHLSQTDEARTRAEVSRRSSIMVLIYGSHAQSEIRAIRRQIDELSIDLVEHREAFFGGGTGEVPHTYGVLAEEATNACRGSTDPDCRIKHMNATCRPALTTAHAEFVSMMDRLKELGDRYFARLSKRMSGFAANLADEEAHRLALLTIEDAEAHLYSSIVGPAQAWTHYENHFRKECVEPLPAEVLNPPALAGAPSPGNCQGALKAMNLRAALGPTSLKISCERIEQSFASEVIPLVNVFVDVKLDFRTGHVSVWAGSKAGGGSVIDAGFKSGVYVKLDGQGEFVDAGWRVGPSVNVGAGAAEFGAYNTEIDMSFTSSPTPGY